MSNNEMDMEDPNNVLRQMDRTRALRRQSVMRARRESGGALEHSHHEHPATDAESNSKRGGRAEAPLNTATTSTTPLTRSPTQTQTMMTTL